MVENPLWSLLNSTTEMFYLRKYSYKNGGEKRADSFEESLMQELIPADIIKTVNREQRYHAPGSRAEEFQQREDRRWCIIF